MLTRGLTCVFLGALTAPASATTFTGRADAGPVIAGERVLWGQQYSDESGAVKLDGRVIARFPAPTGKRRHRSFGDGPGGVSGSPSRLAYRVVDARETGGLGDSDVRQAGALLSVDGGPFTDPLRCGAESISTAIEGDTVALGVVGAPACQGVYVNGRRLDANATTQVKLAGPYVAWLAPDTIDTDQIKVADVATGALVGSFPSPTDAFDIDERGNVITFTRRGLLIAGLADHRPRVLTPAPWVGSFAAAGGRVAYISRTKGDRPGRLVVTDLRGKVLRRLQRYGAGRWPAGEIALTGGRIAWGVRRGSARQSHAPGEIRTVGL